MSCQCGCGRLIHNLDMQQGPRFRRWAVVAPQARPRFRLHFKIIKAWMPYDKDREAWWVSKEFDTRTTEMRGSAAMAIRDAAELFR